MGDLAARLKSKGLSLEAPAPPPSLGSSSSSSFAASALKATSSSLFAASSSRGAATGRSGAKGSTAPPAAPAPLGLSSAQRQKLFTPLLEQGTKAVRQELRAQEQAQDDLLDSVLVTLRKWVQECLARDEKRERLLEKGMLKCRVQAKWSDGLHQKLKQLVASFNARLAADCEKENAEKKHPAWLPRNEKWLVGFDAAAFEAFLSAYPHALDPPVLQVRAFAEEFGAAKSPLGGEALREALQSRFGPLRPATVERARRIAGQARKGTKRKGGPGAGGEEQRTRIESREDVAWAASMLAPMGLKPDGGEPVVRAPAALATPILTGLASASGLQEDLVELLRETQIGKVVAGYRHHPNAEVAKASKELVAAWRTACRERQQPPQ